MRRHPIGTSPDRPRRERCSDRARWHARRRQRSVKETDHGTPGRQRSLPQTRPSSMAATPPTSRISTPATRPIPRSVDAEWQALLRRAEGRQAGRREERQGRVLEEAELADRRQWRARLGARRQLGRGREGRRRQDQGQGRRPRASSIGQADVQQATRDSVRAIMMIRAYRMRGHLHAKLDPLGIEPRPDRRGAAPVALRLHARPTGTARSSSTTCSASNSRPSARWWRSCERTYCQTLGVEFMHISDPAEKAWIQERIEGPDKEIAFTREGKRAILNKLVEAEGFEKFLDLQVHRHQALRPRRRRVADPGARADHQARRRTRRARRSCSAWPIAAA